MTSDEFRLAISRAGYSQSTLASRLMDLGDPRPRVTILRNLSNYTNGTTRVPGEMIAFVNLLAEAA